MTALDESAAAGEQTARPLRKDAARNRAALIAAARTVFADRGLEASLDDIAHEAGVGVGTAYRHFANKYELAEAIFAEAIDEVVVNAEAAAQADDAWQGLVGFLESVASAQTADRGLREVLMGAHLVDDELTEQINDRISTPLRTLVERGKQQGSVRPDAEVSDVGVVLTMLCGVADLAADEQPELWRRYQPILLAGLRPGGPEFGADALTEQQMRDAMASHKRRLVRAARGEG